MYRLDCTEGSGRPGALTAPSIDVYQVWNGPSGTVAKRAAEIELSDQKREA